MKRYLSASLKKHFFENLS
jgi:hypothetical protein